MKGKTNNAASKIASWRSGSTGFFKFLEDVKPLLRSHRGGFEPFLLTGRERNEIARFLDGSYSTCVLCWPRRHGKTVTLAMLIVWRFLTRQTENHALVANSEKQAVDVCFRSVLEAIQNTPFLRSLVDAGEIKVGADRIDCAATGSTIQAFSNNPAALYGKKLTVAQISELHASKSEGVLDALSGSLIDSADSWLLIDSTVGPRSSPLFGLYNIAQRGEDPKLFFSHICYDDMEHAAKDGPAWIDADSLRSLSKRMLPTAFAALHLNKWGDASAALFSPALIAQCIDSYALDAQAVAAGAQFVVGAGVDRAFGLSRHGDRTFTCAVLKCLVGEDEHYYVLDSNHVLLSRLGGIKNALTKYHNDFGMSRVVVESYNAQDVADWAASQPFAGGAEVAHPSRQLKNHIFTTLYTIAAEGRLHIHPSFVALLGELATFEVIQDGSNEAKDGLASLPTFRHARGCHDDAIHALAYAVHSLREIELHPYVLDGVHCYGRKEAARLCVLNGGYLVPLCSNTCRSMTDARARFDGYLGRKPMSPLGFEEFAASKLRNVGIHIVPR